MTTAQQTPPKMKLAIPVSLDDHNYVENLCTNGGFTFETLFAHLLDLYRQSLNPKQPENVEPVKEISQEIEKRKTNAKKRQ